MSPQCWLRVLSITLLTVSVQSNGQLVSFGIVTHTAINTMKPTMIGQSIILININWESYSYRCNASIHNNNTKYLCYIDDIFTTKCDYTNYVSPVGLYSITVLMESINMTASLIIDEIIVNLNDNSYYIINSFCIDDEYQHIGYNPISSTNCTDFNYQQEYEYLIINTSKSITIHFIENVTLWINSSEPGLLQITDIHNIENTMFSNGYCHNIKVSSFGFHDSYWDIHISHHEDVTLTLFWFDQILQCKVNKSKDFMCNHNDIILIESNTGNVDYKMQIDYDNKLPFFVSNLSLIDLFVIDLFGNRYNILMMMNDQKYIKSLYIDFDENILLYPNTSSFGSILPPKIRYFGIQTTQIVPKKTVHLRLYWNTYLYVCSLRINNSIANKVYLCNVSDTNQVISDCMDPNSMRYEYKFALTIDVDENNGFQINQIFVTDETGNEYCIDRFCEPLKNGDDENLETKCNEEFSGTYQYNAAGICYGNSQCNTNSLLAFIFQRNIFDYNLNSDNQGKVLFDSEFSLNPYLSCNLTLFPTMEPTKEPTFIQTINTVSVDSDHLPHDLGLEDKWIALIILGSFIVIIILCGTLVVCYCRIRQLQTKLEKQTSLNLEQNVSNKDITTTFDISKSMQKLELTNFNMDTSTYHVTTPQTSIDMVRSSMHSSLLSTFKKNSTQSILPPGQPGMNNAESTEVVAADGPVIVYNEDNNNNDDDDPSIHTDESQKEEEEKKNGNETNNDYLNEHIEGYIETKLESAVHLEVIKAGNDDDDDGDDDTKEEEEKKDDILLNGMLVDVLKMESSNNIHKLMNRKKYDADSDDSDDIYEKPKSENKNDDEKVTPNDEDISQMINDEDNEGIDDNYNYDDGDDGDDEKNDIEYQTEMDIKHEEININHKNKNNNDENHSNDNEKEDIP